MYGVTSTCTFACTLLSKQLLVTSALQKTLPDISQRVLLEIWHFCTVVDVYVCYRYSYTYMWLQKNTQTYVSALQSLCFIAYMK